MNKIDPKYLSWFKHEDSRRFVAERLGNAPWITLYELLKDEGREGGAWFSALIPNADVAGALKDHTWDLSIGDGRPGFTVYGDQRRPPEYNHFTAGEPVPLVLVRSFDNHRDDYCELLEEFRLFHNLYEDKKTGKYFKVDDNGDEEEIARVGSEKVEVKLRAIRQFCAVKNMHLAVFFELDKYSEHALDDLGLAGVTNVGALERVEVPYLTYELYAGDYLVGSGTRKSFSRIVGKKLFPPLPIEQCGLDPYSGPDQFEEFIIGIDADGNPVRFTCDPDKLANYFGKNKDAPHFLTPVFFKREVLAKYYANPTRYEVLDSHLRCQGAWSLRLDNNHKDYVIVFLGDLGQGLGHKEQLYWKSFNVAPDGVVSSTNFRRSFLGEWADAESADLAFKAQFEYFQNEWAMAIGWPLFKPLVSGDEHLLIALHIPLAEDQSEFDTQVLALTKTLIDSLNEKMLAAEMPDLPKDTKGITKFEKFCAAHGLAEMSKHVQFLRDLQDLRSSGVGHRKSDNYEKVAAKISLNERGFRETFEALLRKAIALLDALSAAVPQLVSSRATSASTTTPGSSSGSGAQTTNGNPSA